MAATSKLYEKRQKQKKALASVGLSYCLQSHRKEDQKYTHRQHFTISQNEYTGEIKVSVKSASLHTKQKNDHDRGKRSGKLFIEGLTPSAKHKIQKGSRVLESVHKHEKGLKAYCSMITLTYGKDFPTDHESKKHLDTFLKRLRRLHKDCKYLWVAEKQKRGAIHYHILTPYYTKKEWLNSAWDEIVQNWQSEKGYTHQQVRPNVIKVFQAGSYLAKYLQKEGQNIGGNGYGIDQKTRNLMKDQSVTMLHHDLTKDQVNEIAEKLITDITKDQDKTYTWKSKYTGYMGAWSSGVNYFSFNEWLDYTRHEYSLATIKEHTEKRIEIYKGLIE